MIRYDKYTKQIQKEILLKMGYKVSEYSINRFLKYFLYNLSYEIKDLKVIKLPGILLKPKRKTVRSYLRFFPKQDILKPSKFFGLIETRKNMKLIRFIKKEYGR